MERTISFMNGEGSIGHNTRSFIAKNVDASRTKDNIVLINEDIKQVYHKLFDKALEEYNNKQTRKDRKIKSYYEKIARSKQEKLFYEVVVQIGNRNDTGVYSYMGDKAAEILKEYVDDFIKNNPQLYVLGAYIHMDEETPHLHLDFVPWSSGNKRGLETKNSLKGALASQGFVGEGKAYTEWQQWCEAEKESIAKIMKYYGIKWNNLGTHHPHLSVMDYKKRERQQEILELMGKSIEMKRETEEHLKKFQQEKQALEIDNAILKNRKEVLRRECETVDRSIADKKNELADVRQEVERVTEIVEFATLEARNVKDELREMEQLKREMMNTTDGDYQLREMVIKLRYQNQLLQHENEKLSEKLEKAYDFMKQVVIAGVSMYEKFKEWIGERVRVIERKR